MLKSRYCVLFQCDVILFQSNSRASVALSQKEFDIPDAEHEKKPRRQQRQHIVVCIEWTGLTSCHWASLSLAAASRLPPFAPSHCAAVPASGLPSSAAVPPGGLRAGHASGMSLRDLLLVWRVK